MASPICCLGKLLKPKLVSTPIAIGTRDLVSGCTIRVAVYRLPAVWISVEQLPELPCVLVVLVRMRGGGAFCRWYVDLDVGTGGKEGVEFSWI